MRGTSSPSLWSLPEVRFGAAVGLEFAATAVCQDLVTTGLAGLVIGTIVVGASLLVPYRYAVALGATAWAFLTGFVVNEGGQLTFTSADVQRAAVLVGAATLAWCAASIGTSIGHSQPRRRNTTNSEAQTPAIRISARG